MHLCACAGADCWIDGHDRRGFVGPPSFGDSLSCCHNYVTQDKRRPELFEEPLTPSAYKMNISFHHQCLCVRC